MTEHTEWCRKTFDLIRHGGLWAIPRTGLVFRKTGNALVWVGTLPPMVPDFVPKEYRHMKLPEDIARKGREIDFNQTVEEFGAAGVPVLKASVIKAYATLDEAKAFYGKMDATVIRR